MKLTKIIRDEWNSIDEQPPVMENIDLLFKNGSILRGCLINENNDVIWGGAVPSERMYGIEYIPVTHWKLQD